jgi:hypothetical protein
MWRSMVSLPQILVGINSNFSDTATVRNSCITDTDVICQELKGTSPSNRLEKIGDDPTLQASTEAVGLLGAAEE